MRGIEISREYYERFGKVMLENDFSDILDRLAVGFVGEGSQCLGFDDDISRDHDFEPGFCIFMTREDERGFGFRLERAYSRLPREFMGLKRGLLSPVGGNRCGVLVIEDFYKKFLGSETAPESLLQWLSIPSYALAAATGGEVFFDNLGAFSSIRDKLKNGYPEDVRCKKLAAHAVMMAQSGQYNYERCIKRGESGAAQLAIFEFVKNAISTVYLLNNAYEPFYKWAYRGMRELSILSDLESTLTALAELENSGDIARQKAEIIEDVSAMIIAEYKRQAITQATCQSLEKHAYSIIDGIADATLRNMHIMDGI